MIALSGEAFAQIVAKLRTAGCVFADEEARLLIASAASRSELVAMLDRRTGGIPLEHVVGWVEFCGMRLRIEPGVFVPRRRSELLAHTATELARENGRRPCVLLDLCCGNGAIGATIGSAFDSLELYAVDVESAAVRCARENLPQAHVYIGNLYEPLPAQLERRVDVIVANAPYVPSNEIELLPAEARLHEPLVALDGGHDGLDVTRKIAAGASRWLTADGHLLIETGAHQAPKTVEIFASNGFQTDVVSSEEFGATVVVGSTKKPAYGS
ncbi:MAG: putative protein N(5)-glutamine methyltransferase [Candidatus Eremiobacteraeota bacterium]|nr:putative protein N(5)-glutamine methyltransferase [Candidatus Eremiobacteraeota bacterium]